ncbi:helix-turn-helix domain-containing protein [Kribbella sp. NPDC006257]|uniref:helix-turn-helix domain-containing protein n=1 Tax=Kribbella sp. NPDC006257 TaxID=3156738 RepID=UPI0033A48148
MLRIHFSATDLARLQIRDTPHPLWEALLSLHVLQSDGGRHFADWRQDAARRIYGAEPLLELAWPWGYSPDFLTPDLPGSGIEEAVAALLHTPGERIAADLRELGAIRRLGAANLAVADGDARALRWLGTAVRAYHHSALGPIWPAVLRLVAEDAEMRRRILEADGVDRLLATLHPAAVWRRPVLEIEYPVDQNLRLGGRGLELIPSYFCEDVPITLKDPALPPVLVYPATRPGPVADSSLAAMVGNTRAAVLGAVAAGRTTTELAHELGVSAANISHHVGVLRKAGMLSTQRHGANGFHRLTLLGAAVLGRRL